MWILLLSAAYSARRAVGCIQSNDKNADCHMRISWFELVEGIRPNEIDDVISAEIPNNEEDPLSDFIFNLANNEKSVTFWRGTLVHHEKNSMLTMVVMVTVVAIFTVVSIVTTMESTKRKNTKCSPVVADSTIWRRL